jgi:hypothetical protein
MRDVFWIGLGVVGFGLLCGLIGASRSRTTGTLAGAAIGVYLGLMFGFPLLALGLSTS